MRMLDNSPGLANPMKFKWMARCVWLFSLWFMYILLLVLMKFFGFHLYSWFEHIKNIILIVISLFPVWYFGAPWVGFSIGLRNYRRAIKRAIFLSLLGGFQFALAGVFFSFIQKGISSKQFELSINVFKEEFYVFLLFGFLISVFSSLNGVIFLRIISKKIYTEKE